MPTITCDPGAAADRLKAAGVDIESGNTDGWIASDLTVEPTQ